MCKIVIQDTHIDFKYIYFNSILASYIETIHTDFNYINLLTPCSHILYVVVDSSWNVMAHSDARKGKWRGNWRMEWVDSTLHTTSENGVSSITTTDTHSSAASSRLNWRPRRFKWTCPFRRKTKSGFCACAITFQLASTTDFTMIFIYVSICLVFRL